MHFKRAVANASGRAKEAYIWLAKLDTAKTWEELEEPLGSTWANLDNKIALGLYEIIHGEFQNTVSNREAELEKQNKMLGGLQIAFMRPSISGVLEQTNL